MASYYSSQLMTRGNWCIDEYIEVLEQPASLAAMAQAAKAGLHQAQFEILIHGNVTSDEARATANDLVESFKELGVTELLPEVKRMEVTKLPLKAVTVFEYDLAAKNPAQENSCTMNIYEVGPYGEDEKRDACLAMVSHISATSAFSRLRTDEQLGYVVQATPWGEHHVVGLAVIVQGTVLPPKGVDQRIEAWLSAFGEELRVMSEEEFANNIQGVVNASTARASRMLQEASQHWNEIVSQRYKFDRVKCSVETIQALSKEDIVMFFNNHFAADAPLRRKASVQILGTSARGLQEAGPLSSVEAVRKFQESVEFYLAPPPAAVPVRT